MQGDQQAYDRGTSIFSPDGRLYQVEYAREAVKRGSASVGVKTADGVVLAARRRVRSPLMDPNSVEKLHEIDSHLGVASAGHAADARQLVEFARQAAQRERLRFDEPLGVETLTKELADHVQEYTQQGGARPFGTALLVGGIGDSGPTLYETDPSGTPSAWNAAAVGRNSGEIQEYLESEYVPDADLESGIDLALSALAAPEEDEGEGFDPTGVGVATVADGTGYEQLDADERHERLDALGLLDSQAS